jgi:hypothetical protein
MSYDFHLFAAAAGVDPRAIARADDEGFEPARRDPAKERVKRKVADALIARDPNLELATFDYEEIARLHRIRVDVAYERMRHLELTDVSAGGSGVQIMLFDDRASVTVPFWHEGVGARADLERVWGYIDVICRETGYEVFDPQIDRVIDRGAFDNVFANYMRAMARVKDIAVPQSMKRRPWWKFW